jgi:hypothetical protein
MAIAGEETLADTVKRLEHELDLARRKMATCKHDFSKPVRATRDVPDYSFSHYEGHGSDPEPVYDVSMKKEYGWERSCTLCGYTEYTRRSKPMVVGSEPDFN